jgi:hypothetical protein
MLGLWEEEGRIILYRCYTVIRGWGEDEVEITIVQILYGCVCVCVCMGGGAIQQILYKHWR